MHKPVKRYLRTPTVENVMTHLNESDRDNNQISITHGQAIQLQEYIIQLEGLLEISFDCYPKEIIVIEKPEKV